MPILLQPFVKSLRNARFPFHTLVPQRLQHQILPAQIHDYLYLAIDLLKFLNHFLPEILIFLALIPDNLVGKHNIWILFSRLRQHAVRFFPFLPLLLAVSHSLFIKRQISQEMPVPLIINALKSQEIHPRITKPLLPEGLLIHSHEAL